MHRFPFLVFLQERVVSSFWECLTILGGIEIQAYAACTLSDGEPECHNTHVITIVIIASGTLGASHTVFLVEETTVPGHELRYANSWMYRTPVLRSHMCPGDVLRHHLAPDTLPSDIPYL